MTMAYHDIVCIDVVRTVKTFNRMQRDTSVFNCTWRERERERKRERERERESMNVCVCAKAIIER